MIRVLTVPRYCGCSEESYREVPKKRSWSWRGLYTILADQLTASPNVLVNVVSRLSANHNGPKYKVPRVLVSIKTVNVGTVPVECIWQYSSMAPIRRYLRTNARKNTIKKDNISATAWKKKFIAIWNIRRILVTLLVHSCCTFMPFLGASFCRHYFFVGCLPKGQNSSSMAHFINNLFGYIVAKMIFLNSKKICTKYGIQIFDHVGITQNYFPMTSETPLARFEIKVVVIQAASSLHSWFPSSSWC